MYMQLHKNLIEVFKQADIVIAVTINVIDIHQITKFTLFSSKSRLVHIRCSSSWFQLFDILVFAVFKSYSRKNCTWF